MASLCLIMPSFADLPLCVVTSFVAAGQHAAHAWEGVGELPIVTCLSGASTALGSTSIYPAATTLAAWSAPRPALPLAHCLLALRQQRQGRWQVQHSVISARLWAALTSLMHGLADCTAHRPAFTPLAEA